MNRFSGWNDPSSVYASLRISLLSVLLLLAVHVHQVAGQCTMTCIDTANVGLSFPCSEVLNANDFIMTAPDCPAPFTIFVQDEMENNLGGTITASMIGQPLEFVVTAANGQSCWGVLNVLDEDAPIVDCPPDATISCLMSIDDVPVLGMDGVDDCSDVTISFLDSYNVNFSCSTGISAVVTRDYTVVDAFGNTNADCSQLIIIENADLNGLTFPPDVVLNAPGACMDTMSWDPANTGYPEVNGLPIINNPICNIGVDYTDIFVPTCNGSFKIVRDWSVWDNCVAQSLVMGQQIIDVLDITPPSVTAPADMTINADQADCTANFDFPAAVIDDLCCDELSISVQGTFGMIFTNGGLIEGIEPGVYTVTYTAIDGCNNVGSDDMTLTVVDLTPPVAHCKAAQVVTLTASGDAYVPAASFNKGSHDACGPVYFKIKRMVPSTEGCVSDDNPDQLFDDRVRICCEDIDDAPIMLILRVYDQYPDPGPVSDDHLAGRFSECMVEVTPQDKERPTIQCPADMTIDCREDLSDLSVYGLPTADDNCGEVEVTENAVMEIDQCNVGRVTRTFIAEDASGNLYGCSQVITIVNNEPFDGFNETHLQWPADITVEGCAAMVDPDVTGRPTINEDACALVGVSYDDAMIEITDDACFGVVRTWSVIDWCQFEANIPNPYTSDNGFWTFEQHILAVDTVPPIFLNPSDITVDHLQDDCADQFFFVDQAVEVDDCTSDMDIEFHYEVDFHSDGSIDRETWTNDSDLSAIYPIGVHTIFVTADDLCGNEGRDTITLTIRDSKAPTLILIDGLAVDLMVVGEGESMLDVEAAMFDGGSSDNCTPFEDLIFSFSSDPNDQVQMFDCNDVGDLEVTIWLTDAFGNQSWASTSLSVQDNADNCPDMLNRRVSGLVFNEYHEMLSEAGIQLEDNHGNQWEADIEEGHYVFDGIPADRLLILRPEKTDEPLAGVSTLDVLLIQQHILGLNLLDSPYKRMAADVNRSGSISAADLVELKKLILQLQETFRSGQSWGFIDTKAEMVDDPIDVGVYGGFELSPETSNASVDFVAYKYGDVNAAAEDQSQQRGHKRAHLTFEEASFDAEQRLSVPIMITEKIRSGGGQLSLILDAADAHTATIKAGVVPLRPDDYHIYTKDGRTHVALSWITVQGVVLNPGDILFTLEFSSVGAGHVADALRLGHAGLAAEIYTLEGDIFPVELQPQDNTESETIFFPNQPNPFSDQTTIPMYLKRPQHVRFTVLDIRGQTVYQTEQRYDSGYQEIEFYSNETLKPGLYFYQLVSEDGYLTKSMIIER